VTTPQQLGTASPRPVRTWNTAAGLVVREVAPVDVAPVAQTVVLVHGAMDRGSSFRRIEWLLPTATVVSYDRRGYAGSLHVEPSGDLDTHLADLTDVVNGRTCVVFGHSLGGVLTLTLAARRPDLVRSAVVFEPPFPWFPWWPQSSTQRIAEEQGPAAAAESFLQRFLGERIWGRLPEVHRAERRREGPALLADMAALRTGRPFFDPSDLRCPTVIGHGERSHAMYERGIEEFRTGLAPGAPVDICRVPGARHGAHLSHPGDLAEMVRQKLFA
jgi:pimeloyl-ACP methyl ester carboxylesterase